VLVGSVICLVAGWLLGYVALAAIGVSGLLALVIGVGWLALQPAVRADRHIEPKRVTRGESAVAVVTIMNPSRLWSPSLELADPVGQEVATGRLPPLSPGQEDTSSYTLPTDHRGVFDVGPLRIGRSDPFHLLDRSSAHGRVLRLYVHPRVHEITPRPAGRHRDVEGATRDTAPEGGITFHAIREYQEGDDLRHIHWRATAHTGDLMVRQYIDTSQPRTTVVLDNRRSVHDAASLEVAVEIAASVVIASSTMGFPIDLLSVDGQQLGGNQATAGDLLLDALAAMNLTDENDLLAPFRLLTSTGGIGNTLVLVTTAHGAADSVAAITRSAAGVERIVLVNVRPSLGSFLITAHHVTAIDAETSEDFARRWQTGSVR